jgi:hypothetical protein
MSEKRPNPNKHTRAAGQVRRFINCPDRSLASSNNQPDREPTFPRTELVVSRLKRQAEERPLCLTNRTFHRR